MFHTSQCFRIAERPPATALRGGKASEDSFTKFMANLVAEYAVDFQFDLFSYAALGSTVYFERSGRSLCLFLKIDRILPETVWSPGLCEGMIR